jgi:hypothetical protein
VPDDARRQSTTAFAPNATNYKPSASTFWAHHIPCMTAPNHNSQSIVFVEKRSIPTKLRASNVAIAFEHRKPRSCDHGSDKMLEL